MSSGLDCIGCGGYVSLEHLGKVRICEACRGRERDDRPDCGTCEYSPGAIYEHASDCYDPEDDRPNLCSGTGVHYDDCRGQWVPCPDCQPQPRLVTKPLTICAFCPAKACDGLTVIPACETHWDDPEREAWRLESENKQLRAALQETRGYALRVVGASEAYGEAESVHLWQEVADIADAMLTARPAGAPVGDGEQGHA